MYYPWVPSLAHYSKGSNIYIQMTLGEFGVAKLFLFLHRCLVILDLSATGLYVGCISHSYSAAISHIPCVCVSLSHTHAKYSISESAK